jgi:hypothetical protein
MDHETSKRFADFSYETRGYIRLIHSKEVLPTPFLKVLIQRLEFVFCYFL